MKINLEFFVEPEMLDVPHIYVSNISDLRFGWQLVIFEGFFRVMVLFLYIPSIWTIE